MELRHLRYFVVLAHRLHFTQAAEELMIAQPALSQQIQALERELGVRLFERTPRHIRLTPAGQGLLVHAERVLADVDTLSAEMHAYAGLQRGRLRIGLLQSLGASWLAGLLARFHARYGGIELVLHEDVTEPMIEQVEMGGLDLAWMHTIGTIFPQSVHPQQIEVKAVSTEAVLLAGAPHHRLAGQKHIAWNELQAEEFILFKPGSGLRQVVMHLAQQANFRAQVVFESGDISSIRALVSEGVGISVFPQSVIDTPGRMILPLDLSPALPHRTIQLAWHQQRASIPIIQAFLTFVQEDLCIHPWL
ncbi:MAG TPA: LysR family transcriptional regulator [Ktedonobacteraceae bacterium]|jgi:LysR family hydrogen peroxide-inducible transcriptional activator|nr:LysR family transcriptional regulator [Ktedonobacteraceae bacterium]